LTDFHFVIDNLTGEAELPVADITRELRLSFKASARFETRGMYPHTLGRGSLGREFFFNH